MTHTRVVLRAVLTALAVACVQASARGQTGVTDLAGRSVGAIDPAAVATVLVFTAVECPISDRYAPAVRRLADRYAPKGVRFWIVYPNHGELPAAAGAHAKAFSYGLPVALDTERALADRAEASVTPEAAVFGRDGRLMYHGRIDDRYVDFGVDRPAPTRHDLDEAIAAVVAGRPVARTFAPAVGCAIVRARP